FVGLLQERCGVALGDLDLLEDECQIRRGDREALPDRRRCSMGHGTGDHPDAEQRHRYRCGRDGAHPPTRPTPVAMRPRPVDGRPFRHWRPNHSVTATLRSAAQLPLTEHCEKSAARPAEPFDMNSGNKVPSVCDQGPYPVDRSGRTFATRPDRLASWTEE